MPATDAATGQATAVGHTNNDDNGPNCPINNDRFDCLMVSLTKTVTAVVLIISTTIAIFVVIVVVVVVAVVGKAVQVARHGLDLLLQPREPAAAAAPTASAAAAAAVAADARVAIVLRIIFASFSSNAIARFSTVTHD